MKASQENEILSRIIEISADTSKISERLTRAGSCLCRHQLAPVIAFYLVNRRQRLVLRVITGPEGGRELPIPAPSYLLPDTDDPLLNPATTLIPQPLDPDIRPENDPQRLRNPHGWSFPLHDEERVYGVMALMGESSFPAAPETVRFLQVIARLLTLSLRCSTHRERDRILVRQLKFLHQIGAWLNSGGDLDEIFNRLPSATPLFFANSIARLTIFAAGPDDPPRIIEHGRPDAGQRALIDELAARPWPPGELSSLKVVGRHDSEASEPAYRAFFKQFLAHITTPLPGAKGNLGCLEFFLLDNNHARELLPIEDEELELLEILALHIAATIEREKTRSQLESATRTSVKRNRQLTLLHRIKNALMAADSPEKIIRLTLGALVSPEGFASTAALYLETGNSSAATRVFYARTPDRRDFETTDNDEELVERLLAASENHPESLQQRLAGLTLPPLEATPARFQQALASGRPTILPISLAAAIDSRFQELLPQDRIITIPLADQEKHTGLLMTAADHFSHEDLNYITLFTDAAGLALDNTRLYLSLKNSLDNLNQAQMRLTQSEKLVALGEMAASIAHEIKNPLVSIGGFARRLHKKIPDDTREKTYSRIITKEIERLEGIVNNVLALSRPETGCFTPTDLNQLTAETRDLFTRELKKHHIELRLQLAPDLEPVECDGNQIKQVLVNLINNSIQALNELPDEKAKFIRLRTASYCEIESRRKYALIEIEDNGGGIPEKVIHDIFNPFFTTKHSGTGLGLPICYRIVLNHGGDIHFHNRVGTGVRMVVTLPVRQDRAPAA